MTAWLKEHPNSNSGSGWWRRNPEKARLHIIRFSLRRYGLTIEDYERLWDKQGGKCANPRCAATFLRSAMNRKVDGLHVDHDHVTGRVRGLLCPRCNTALGHIGDDRDRLLGLVEYLSEVLN
jgi:hypothetical protein